MVEAAVTLRIRRLLLAGAIALVVQLPVGAAALSSPSTCAAADGTHHVALVVQHGDGATVIRCVAFAGSSVSGEQALASSGVSYETVSFGGLNDAVCQVDGEPATFPPDCWTSTSNFWALFIARAGGAWFASSLGISSLTLRDGDTEGLRFEPQAQPIAPTVKGNCPTATPPPIATPRPIPRSTPKPTLTTGPGQPTEPPTPVPAATTPTATLPSAQPSLGPTPIVSDNPPSPGAVAIVSPVEPAGSSADPLVAAPASAASSDDAPAGAPIALAVGLLVVAGLAGLAVVRARSGPGHPR